MGRKHRQFALERRAVSLATVLTGFAVAFRRLPRSKWMERHATFMGWGYVGLVAAFFSELAVRVPRLRFWPAVIVAMITVCIVGAHLIHTRIPRIAARMTATEQALSGRG